jgi:hypothetical protein
LEFKVVITTSRTATSLLASLLLVESVGKGKIELAFSPLKFALLSKSGRIGLANTLSAVK